MSNFNIAPPPQDEDAYEKAHIEKVNGKVKELTENKTPDDLFKDMISIGENAIPGADRKAIIIDMLKPFSAMQLKLFQTAESQTKQVIDLTQSLVTLTEQMKSYTITLVALTKWIKWLTIVVAIIGFAGIYPLVKDNT